MMYWVDAKKLNEFIQMRGKTAEQIENEICYRPKKHELVRRLLTEGGPTREHFVLGDIGDAISIPWSEFVKTCEEEGDEISDIRVVQEQMTRPLDYDESHYRDRSIGLEKLEELKNLLLDDDGRFVLPLAK